MIVSATTDKVAESNLSSTFQLCGSALLTTVVIEGTAGVRIPTWCVLRSA